MKYRENKRTGDKISEIGMGTAYVVEADRKEAVRTVSIVAALSAISGFVAVEMAKTAKKESKMNGVEVRLTGLRWQINNTFCICLS